ncbi:MAG: metalloprotease, partial [Flavobacteriales bacterium]|nr:metalloprotease [Flavobacteriales bacterium]
MTLGLLYLTGLDVNYTRLKAIIASSSNSISTHMTSNKNVFLRSLSILTLLTCFAFSNAQDSRSIIQDYLSENQAYLKMQDSDISDWIITNEYYSNSTKVNHVYITQTMNDIEIVNGVANFNIRDGKVFSMGDRLMRGVAQKAQYISPSISPQEAIGSAARQLGIEVLEPLKIVNPISSTEFVFDKEGLSLEEVPVKLVYERTEKGDLKLAWDLNIYTLDELNWWSVRIDAQTGDVLSKNNWVLHCDFGSCGYEFHSTMHESTLAEQEAMSQSKNPMPLPGAYNVFAIPTESPAHGPRTIVADPEDPIASPFGWHDTDGEPGEEYTITRGNNVHAYEDRQDNNVAGDAPDGGVDLTFDYPYDDELPAFQSLDAATVNLFYMNNIMHDVWYQYGFDEASGNFQEENYTGAAGQENDYVQAESQDGSGLNNANFATPPDGIRPRMQMYLWADNAANSDFSVNAPPS